MKKKLLALLALMTCASMTLATGCDAFGGVTSISGAPSSSVEDAGSENSDSTVNSSIDDENSSDEENSSGGDETENKPVEIVTDIGALVTDEAREEEIFQAIVAALNAEDDTDGSYTNMGKVYKLADADDWDSPANWCQTWYSSYNATTREGYSSWVATMDEMYQKEDFKVFKENDTYYGYHYFEDSNEEASAESYLQYLSAESAQQDLSIHTVGGIEPTQFAGMVYAASAQEYRAAHQTVADDETQQNDFGETMTREVAFYENQDNGLLSVLLKLSSSGTDNNDEQYSFVTEYQLLMKDGKVYGFTEYRYGESYGSKDGSRHEVYVVDSFDKAGFDAIKTELPEDVPMEGDNPIIIDPPQEEIDYSVINLHFDVDVLENTNWNNQFYKGDWATPGDGIWGTQKYLISEFEGIHGMIPDLIALNYDVVWYLDAEYTQPFDTKWIDPEVAGDLGPLVYEDWATITDLYGKLEWKEGASMAYIRFGAFVEVKSVEGAYKIVYGDTAHRHDEASDGSWNVTKVGELVFDCDYDEYTVYVNGELVTSDSIVLEEGKKYDILYVGVADSSYCTCWQLPY